jgi:type IV pilus assembly protein PilM
VRAVELNGTGKKVKVQRYFDRAVTTRGGLPDPEELRDVLGEIFKSLPKNSVIGCVEAHDTVTREIPVPFKSDDQIRKVIKYEAEHHLHDCDADDVIVQYAKVGETKEGTNLLVFAAKKDDISRRIEACRDAGVELLGLDLDANGLLSAAQFAGLLDESPDCVLLNIANRSTEILFIHEGALRAVRSVRMGVDSISQGLARDMDIEFAEADQKLAEITTGESGDLIIPADGGLDAKADTEKSHAELEQDLFRQKRDEFVARLKREFVRSSAALRGSSTSKVVVAGPGLKVPGLLDLLSEKLGRELEVFTVSDQFQGKINGDAANFDANGAVACGLALKGLGGALVDLDFRQEELKVANKFELLKGALAVSVTLLFIALMGASFFFVKKKKDLQGEEMYYRITTDAYKQFNGIAQAFNGLGDTLVPARRKVDASKVELGDGDTPHLALKRFVSQLKRMQKHLNQKVGGQGLDPIKSALSRWNAIMGALSKVHEEIEYVDIESLRVEQTTVSLNLIVKDASNASKIQKAISALPAMEDLEADPQLGFTLRRDSEYGKVRLEWREKKRGRR